jgi:hypothetical protein
MRRQHRFLFAMLPSMLGLALLSLSPGGALAGVPAGTRPPTPEGARLAQRARSLGSPENPIPVPGTETRALVLGTTGPSDRIRLSLGSLRAWLLGTPGVVLTKGGGPQPMGDLFLPMQLNVFTGGAIEAALGRSSGLYLEGGRVLLRDPIDALGWGQGDGNYWTSSAGLAFRF